MPEMKLILPGSETVTLSGQTIDKLIRAGDGDATLLYLYLLKSRGQCTTAQSAAALRKTSGEIATAMAALSRMGLVIFEDGFESPGQGQSVEVTPEVGAEVAMRPPMGEPRQYTILEIEREIENGSEFHALVQEAQNSLGKILSPDELLRLFGMYDSLRLPPEVILQLITHCINESRGRGGGRMPSMRYIEKAAYTWEREGIFSLDRAEEYLKNLAARKSARGEIKEVLQISGREFSESEKRYVDEWIDMGFDPGAIYIAYDRTVLNTGKLVWGYMDSIIKSWHGKKLHTHKEIVEKEKIGGRNGAPKDSKSREQRFGPPNREEIERMERLLKRIKEA
ncbi:MAG: DnaD domain protein [Oscillospiraceae bacterium]|nr:DnaD domain protein [Oscillospiraceae bacterium]